jgi:ATP-dependent DNA helicase HFM1/MER3
LLVGDNRCRFEYFNKLQSECFELFFHSDDNAVVTGMHLMFAFPSPFIAIAPTGSGKTILFELAIIRLVKKQLDGRAYFP